MVRNDFMIISTLLLLFLSCTQPISPKIFFQNALGYDAPPSSGDWIVSSETLIENQNIILNGNLTIQASGNLTLRNVTLQLNCSYDGQFHIEIQAGGILTIDAKSIVTSLDPLYAWYLSANSGSTIVLQNSTFSHGGYDWDHSGLRIETGGTRILNCTIEANYFGLHLENADNSILANNTIANCGSRGIYLWHSSHTNITNNIIANCSEKGIELQGGGNNTLSQNIVTNNGQYGFYIANSDNSSICDNHIAVHNVGIVFISMGYSNISGNTVMNSTHGIYLDGGSSHCQVWYNILLSNGGNSLDNNGSNQWDNGTHGNWWDDYTGTDTDGDGIGQTPYRITSVIELYDRYPLVGIGNYPAPSSGEWVISQQTMVRNVELVLSNDLIIATGGSLTIMNASIFIFCNSPGENEVRINDGGSLFVDSNCHFSAVSSSNGWYFNAEAGSSVMLRASTFESTTQISITTDDARIINCVIKDTDSGISLFSSDNAVIENNTIANCSQAALRIMSSVECCVRENVFFNVEGTRCIEIANSNRCIVSSNSFSSYLNIAIQVGVSENCSVLANSISGGETGIIVSGSSHTVRDNTIEDVLRYGIYLMHSPNSVLINNINVNSSREAYSIGSSPNCTARNNTIIGSGGGISLDDSPFSIIEANLISDTGSVVGILGGITLSNCSYSTLSANHIMTNKQGITIYRSSHCSVSSNIIAKSTQYGIFLDASTNNCRVWYNTLEMNQWNNAYDAGHNQWDNGTHGNWWDDYTGIDADNDGIGDSAYEITPGNSGSLDRYPLMFLPTPDIFPPTIDSPADKTYKIGTTGHFIIWDSYDGQPDSYAIYRDGILIAEENWNGSTIDQSIDGLGIGIYNYTIVVFDQDGRWTSDTVWVTVESVASQTTTESSETKTEETTEPSVSGPGFTFLVIFCLAAILMLKSKIQRKKN